MMNGVELNINGLVASRHREIVRYQSLIVMAMMKHLREESFQPLMLVHSHHANVHDSPSELS